MCLSVNISWNIDGFIAAQLLCVCASFARFSLSLPPLSLSSCRSSSFPLKINKPHWSIKQTEMKNYSIKSKWHELYFLVLCIISLSIWCSTLASRFQFFFLPSAPSLHQMTLQIKLITSTAFIGFNSSNLFYQAFSNGIRSVPLILFICCGEIEVSSIYLTHMLAYTHTLHAHIYEINIISRIYNIYQFFWSIARLSFNWFHMSWVVSTSKLEYMEEQYQRTEILKGKNTTRKREIVRKHTNTITEQTNGKYMQTRMGGKWFGICTTVKVKRVNLNEWTSGCARPCVCEREQSEPNDLNTMDILLRKFIVAENPTHL